jgi:hypothetical protein
MQTFMSVGLSAFLFGLILIPISIIVLVVGVIIGDKKVRKVGLYVLLSAGIIMMLSVLFCSLASQVSR